MSSVETPTKGCKKRRVMSVNKAAKAIIVAKEDLCGKQHEQYLQWILEQLKSNRDKTRIFNTK